MLQAIDIRKKYGDNEILKGVTVRVDKGEVVAVIGRSGSGKSTLAKHFNAVLLPSGGACYVDGMNTADEDKLFDIREKAGMVFQNPNDQIFKNTALDEVMFGPLQIGMSKKQAKEVALKALDMVGLKGAEKINPYELGYRDAFLSPEEFVAYKKANA